MSDVAITNQLPPRTTASTRWPRKWSTLGGRCTSTSTTVITTDDTDSNESPSKTNGHHRHSTSLLRKASTISRNNGTAATEDETSPPSLKKSRSLMNVLRAKLNSPAVIRRFRSKSRENSKQTVTEINGHSTEEQQEVKPANDEEIVTTRKSRKRDPSPMRRLANRISQLTRHQSATPHERQKKSPTKSMTNDEIAKTSSPAHNKDKVDHINACYDEIRAKYFKNNNNNNISIQQNPSHDDVNNRSLSTISMNGSLLSNDFSNNSQRVTAPVLPDDPLLQARKQANLKLNCLLSGYTLTTPFATHEKSFGRNDLFKFNHYYDVGKRKYDWNAANTNNQVFSNMRTRPISKSIDNFRPANVTDEVPIPLEQINVVDHDRLVRAENNHEDVPRVLPSDNELVLRQDNDLNESEPNSSNIDVSPAVPVDHETFVTTTTTSADSDKNNTIAHSKTATDRDEEFEQNFLRAVDRALGVVSKDEQDPVEPVVDQTKHEDQSQLNLVQMTERALSSIKNLPDITSDESTSDKQEPHENPIQLTSSALVGRTDEPAIDEVPLVTTEAEAKHDEPSIDEHPVAMSEEKHVEPALNEQPATSIEEKHEESPIVEQPPTTSEEKHVEPTVNDVPTITTEETFVEPAIQEQLESTIEKHDESTITEQPTTTSEEHHGGSVIHEQSADIPEKHDELTASEQPPPVTEEKHEEPAVKETPSPIAEEEHNEPPLIIEEQKHDESSMNDQHADTTEEKHDQSAADETLSTNSEEKHAEPAVNEQPTIIVEEHDEPSVVTDAAHTEATMNKQAATSTDDTNDEPTDLDVPVEIASIMEDLLQQTEESLGKECKNGQTFLVKLDDEEKTIKSQAASYHDLLGLDDQRLTEEVRTDINAVIGEVNLLLRGKLKQFRGLCQANVTKSTTGEPIPLDSDLEGFWDITYPLIDKVKEKFAKLDTRKAKQWAPIEEYDPNDINNRPRVIDDRLKQLQPQQNKSSKIPQPKSANGDLKKLIQERRKAASSTANQNHDIEIFVAPK